MKIGPQNPIADRATWRAQEHAVTPAALVDAVLAAVGV